jgi:hypothetical protein
VSVAVASVDECNLSLNALLERISKESRHDYWTISTAPSSVRSPDSAQPLQQSMALNKALAARTEPQNPAKEPT